MMPKLDPVLGDVPVKQMQESGGGVFAAGECNHDMVVIEGIDHVFCLAWSTILGAEGPSPPASQARALSECGQILLQSLSGRGAGIQDFEDQPK